MRDLFIKSDETKKFIQLDISWNNLHLMDTGSAMSSSCFGIDHIMFWRNESYLKTNYSSV